MQINYLIFLPTWKAVSISSGIGALVSRQLFMQYAKCQSSLHDNYHPKIDDRQVCQQCKEFKPFITPFFFILFGFLAIFASSTAWGMGKWTVTWMNQSKS